MIREQVLEFHRAFDQPIVSQPKVPDDERVRLRLRLIAEEFFETLAAAIESDDSRLGERREAMAEAKSAIGRLISGPIAVDMPELIDGLADLDYVVEGTRIEFGVDGGPIAAEVHRSNMAKLDSDGKPLKRPDGKIVKPDGWTPPDIEGELRRQGWR